MSAKPNTLTMAQSAIYNHALAFSSYWGDASQSEEGNVHFNSLPDELETLKIKPDFRKRWMGGTCAMDITFSQPISDKSQGKIVFKGTRTGSFKGKVNGELVTRLLSVLQEDKKLKEQLLLIDLDSLMLEVSEGTVKCTLTPYGGGMAYLVIPPVRTPIPLPAEQILPMTQVLKQISQHIKQSGLKV